MPAVCAAIGTKGAAELRELGADIPCAHHDDTGPVECRDGAFLTPDMGPLVILVEIELLLEAEKQGEAVLGHRLPVAADRCRDPCLFGEHAGAEIGVGACAPQLNPLQMGGLGRKLRAHIADDDIGSSDLFSRKHEVRRHRMRGGILDERLEDKLIARSRILELFGLSPAHGQDD